MLPSDRQHFLNIPPHHPLANLHRTRFARVHDHQPLLHPILPSLSRLLDGVHTILSPHFFLVPPPCHTGSHRVRVLLHDLRP